MKSSNSADRCDSTSLLLILATVHHVAEPFQSHILHDLSSISALALRNSDARKETTREGNSSVWRKRKSDSGAVPCLSFATGAERASEVRVLGGFLSYLAESPTIERVD